MVYSSSDVDSRWGQAIKGDRFKGRTLKGTAVNYIVWVRLSVRVSF